MTEKPDNEAYIEQIRECIIRECLGIAGVHTIHLYGSVLDRKYFRNDSDIDIGVLGHYVADPVLLFETGNNIGYHLGRDIHLVNVYDAPPVLKIQIMFEGIVLYASDEQKRIEAEGRAIGEYLDYNRAIKPIVIAKYGEQAWKCWSTR